ncbi:MAG: hypothetical protein JW881_19180 [Spirochaetales bacterium]|nr:hypothetical protein [Spirochaetales bacterium]
MNEAKKKYQFIALFPPDNVELKIIDLRRRIFSRFGLVSAMAFPPLIPLLFLPGHTSLDCLREIFRPGFTGFELTTGVITPVSGCFYLTVTSESGFEELLERLEPARLNPKKTGIESTSSDESLIPEFQGFFLAHTEYSIKPENVITLIEPPQPFSFSVFSLAVIETTVNVKGDRWWEKIIWRAPVMVRCRKPKRS